MSDEEEVTPAVPEPTSFLEPAFLALREEWTEFETKFLLKRDLSFSMRTASDDRLIYVVTCSNGHHESYESHTHALSLLVDSFRTRLEDKPETRARVAAWYGGSGQDLENARRILAAMAKTIQDANPDATGEERDVLLSQELDRLQASHAGQ